MQIRLYNPQPLLLNSNIVISDDQYHYLARVMRVKVGDSLRVFNSTDGEFEGRVTFIQKNQLEVELKEFICFPKKEQGLTLYFAPIKNPNASFVIQKATELGVTKVQPIITKHTVVDKINIAKLEAVAIEAAEQCGRFFIPKIFPILKLEDALKTRQHTGPIIFCNEDESSLPLGIYLKEQIPNDVGILIGPEGGFAAHEKSAIIGMNGVSVHLGSNILRAETAIIASLSIYQAILGVWNNK